MIEKPLIKYVCTEPVQSIETMQSRTGTSTGSVTVEKGTPVVEPVACGSPAVRETTQRRTYGIHVYP